MPKIGDINHDGKVDYKDAIALMESCVSAVASDGKITKGDLLLAAETVAKEIWDSATAKE